MNSFKRNIIVFTLSLSIAFAQAGVGIYEAMCLCKNELKSSFYFDQTTDECALNTIDETHKHSCCEKQSSCPVEKEKKPSASEIRNNVLSNPGILKKSSSSTNLPSLASDSSKQIGRAHV